MYIHTHAHIHTPWDIACAQHPWILCVHQAVGQPCMGGKKYIIYTAAVAVIK